MSERTGPDQEKAHLLVAAVRVLAHRELRPPSAEEVAELVDQPPEIVRILIRHLVELGALREVADAYGARLEVGDHLLIEELKAGGGVAIKDEMQSFSDRQREKKEEMQRQFEEDVQSKQDKKFSKLEEDLKKFRGTKGPKTDMWGDPIEQDNE